MNHSKDNNNHNNSQSNDSDDNNATSTTTSTGSSRTRRYYPPTRYHYAHTHPGNYYYNQHNAMMPISMPMYNTTTSTNNINAIHPNHPNAYQQLKHHPHSHSPFYASSQYAARPMMHANNMNVASARVAVYPTSNVNVDHQPSNTLMSIPTSIKATTRNTNTSSGYMGCTCKKSKCLKLYCQCFSSQTMCDKECNCSDCHNTSAPEFVKARKMAIEHILERNPNAFKPSSVKNVMSVHSSGNGGCKCRKSFCLKKYCECFNSLKKCDPNICGCINCHNRGGPQQAQVVKPRQDLAKAFIPRSSLPVPMTGRRNSFQPIIHPKYTQTVNINKTATNPNQSMPIDEKGDLTTKSIKRKIDESSDSIINTAAAALMELCKTRRSSTSTSYAQEPLPTSTLVSIGSTGMSSTIDSVQSFDTCEASLLDVREVGRENKAYRVCSEINESRNPSPSDHRKESDDNYKSAFQNLVIAASSSNEMDVCIKGMTPAKSIILPKQLSFRKICSNCGKTKSEHGELGFGSQRCIFQECGRCGAGVECHVRNNMPMGYKCQLTVKQGAYPGASEKYERKIEHMCEDSSKISLGPNHVRNHVCASN